MSEITPAKLDEIAKTLLGWTKAYAGDVQNVYHPMPGIKTVTRTLYTHDPADAMLVLEAMGKWCADKHQYVLLESEYLKGWTCGVTAIEQSNGERDVLEYEYADTPAGAIFQCAAQLVGRM